MSMRVKVVAGFLGIYLIWGSTFLAVRLAVETIPPFVMMGARCAVAGALLCLIAGAGGARRPSFAEWRNAAIVGAFFFVGGHGVIAWAQRSVPSSFAALMLATVPLWIPLINALRGERPPARVVAALVAGFAGVALLIGVSQGIAVDRMGMLPVIALLVSAVSWAFASVLARSLALPSSVTLAAGLELLLGGLILLVVSGVDGELAGFEIGAVSLRSALAFVGLTLFGSVLTFTVFGWLLRVVAPERVATYAYVNPVVALVLGWWLLDEPVTLAMLVASALILAAVMAAMTDRPLGAGLRRLSSRLARFVLPVG